MKLIVDTGRIIAALIKDSTSRAILLSGKFEFLTINFKKLELDEHRQEIMEKARTREDQFEYALSMLMSHVQIISDLAIESKLDEANAIMGLIDPDDVPFIAAALAVENEGIWSDDLHFGRQTKIRVFKTTSLAKAIME